MEFILDDAKKLWEKYKLVTGLTDRGLPGVALELKDSFLIIHTHDASIYAESRLPVEVQVEEPSKIILNTLAPFEFLLGETEFSLFENQLVATDSTGAKASTILSSHDEFLFTKLLSDKVDFLDIPDITPIKFAMGKRNSAVDYIAISQNVVMASNRFIFAIHKLDNIIAPEEAYATPIAPKFKQIGFLEKRIWFANGDDRCSTTSLEVPVNMDWPAAILEAAVQEDNYAIVDTELLGIMNMMKSVGPWLTSDDAYRAMMRTSKNCLVFDSAKTEIGETNAEIECLGFGGNIEATIDPTQVIKSLDFIGGEVVKIGYTKIKESEIMIFSNPENTKVVGIAPIDNSWYYQQIERKEQ